MGTISRKRKRTSTPANEPTGPKRKAPEEDEDILSDEVDSGSESESDSPSPTAAENNAVPSSPPGETAEERRLRLARAYLRHVGLSEDASDVDIEENERDDEDSADEGNRTLQETAKQQRGVSAKHIADSISRAVSKATIRVCKGHSLPPTCIAIARESCRTAVSGGKDSRLIVWDVETGAQKHMFKPTMKESFKRNPAKADGHVGNILSVAISDDEQLIVSGGLDGLIRCWDLRAGKLVENLKGHRGSVTALAFRAGSRQLFSGSSDRTVKIWDMNDMAYVETLFGHGAGVSGLSSLAMERAVSCGGDGTLRLYKIVEGSQLVFRSTMTMSLDAVTMVNENRFLTGGDDGSVCLWQTNKKKPVAIVEKAHGHARNCESWVSSVAAYRFTDVAMTGGGDGFLRFWKCEDVPKMFPAGSVNVGPGFVNGIAVGQKLGFAAVAVGQEHRLGRWNRIRAAKNTIQFVSIPDVE